MNMSVLNVDSTRTTNTHPLETFEQLESEVRSYIRSFPTVFAKAKNDRMWDIDGRTYIDFFAGAGALNYGHNNERMKRKLLEYIAGDGVIHSLDMATQAKEDFLKSFRDIILAPRGLDYKLMFPGPTGTNAVESAMKIARKVTGRQTIACFTNAFHGMSLGSLAVTGNKFKRGGAGTELSGGVFLPYDGYLGPEFDTTEYIAKLWDDDGSGVELPAAVLIETVQGEGGLNAAGAEWLRRLAEMCRSRGVLLIVDDIQMGCGRTGTFFSFEEAGIEPDVICLSKSIGGYGLPFALTLLRPELDVWSPGEHNGTFRGNNLAFIAAAEALSYWREAAFSRQIAAKAKRIRACLESVVKAQPQSGGEIRGRGLIQGIAFAESGFAERVCREAFDLGVIMETSGPNSEVAKIMPPLTIADETLERGLALFAEAVNRAAAAAAVAPASSTAAGASAAPATPAAPASAVASGASSASTALATPVASTASAASAASAAAATSTTAQAAAAKAAKVLAAGSSPISAKGSVRS